MALAHSLAQWAQHNVDGHGVWARKVPERATLYLSPALVMRSPDKAPASCLTVQIQLHVAQTQRTAIAIPIRTFVTSNSNVILRAGQNFSLLQKLVCCDMKSAETHRAYYTAPYALCVTLFNASRRLILGAYMLTQTESKSEKMDIFSWTRHDIMQPTEAVI
eukprot:COSAG02_NODE_2053_length_9994_cov_7.402628_4_plen_162_part_00